MIDKKVLIAEDNPLNRRVFENIIRQRYHLDVAENGYQAIEKLNEQAFDLILLDIQMPVMDGVTACRIIKSERLSDAPIIAISAYADESDKALFISSGFDDFLPKPVKPQILLRLLSKFLDQGAGIAKPEFPVLSEDTLQKLLKYNSNINIRTVYADFLKETHMLLEEIKALIQAKQFYEVGQKLHTIKGNSGTLGATALFKFSEAFELNIKSQNFDNIEKEYLTLKELVNSFENHLKSHTILSS
ncbi:MAG: Hpt domain-containing response regulator [Mongoliitalea sp.]